MCEYYVFVRYSCRRESTFEGESPKEKREEGKKRNILRALSLEKKREKEREREREIARARL